jgi:hypothetical protein
MEVFAQQCLDLARAILQHTLPSISDDGTITPIDGERASASDSGRVALALGEFYHTTHEATLGKYDLVDLAARTLTAQVFTEAEAEEGLGYLSLGLLSFGPSKERNAVWERLLDPTREQIDKKLLMRADYNDFRQAYNISKAVTRYSIGLSKKDETSRLIDLIVQRAGERSSEGFMDNAPEGAFGGLYDLRGLWAFVFVRQALQLHANIHLRDRKIASLRTVAEKYLKLLPDMVRPDGIGWSFGEGVGLRTQMSCISLILQAFRDNWIAPEKQPLYAEIFRKLFANLFASYIDQEHGFVSVRDDERDAGVGLSTVMANFDAARALAQWSKLAPAVKMPTAPPGNLPETSSRWVYFDRGIRKEQGVFTYIHRPSHLYLQLPLVASQPRESGSLPFPHCVGVFDWPADKYIPVLIPELTFNEGVFVPAFYGKGCVAGLTPSGGLFFKYEQPEAISIDQKILGGVGSWKINWTFKEGKITGEFGFTPKKILELHRFRFMIALGAHHTHFTPPGALRLGEEGQRCQILKDDFQSAWKDPEEVSADPAYRGNFGRIHYLQTLERSHNLTLRPGKVYNFSFSFEPQVVC